MAPTVNIEKKIKWNITTPNTNFYMRDYDPMTLVQDSTQKVLQIKRKGWERKLREGKGDMKDRWVRNAVKIEFGRKLYGTSKKKKL